MQRRPFVNWNTSFQFKDDFSWTRGRHQVKFGGELRRLRYNQIGAVVPRGRFTWNGQYSNSPMADMLLGFMSNSESQIGAPILLIVEYFIIYPPLDLEPPCVARSGGDRTALKTGQAHGKKPLKLESLLDVPTGAVHLVSILRAR